MDINNLNLEVEFVDKTRFEIEYKDLSEFNGKLVILANPTSLLVCNLLPSARDITDIGDPNEKFNSIYTKTGYFDKLYVNGKEIT